LSGANNFLQLVGGGALLIMAIDPAALHATGTPRLSAIQ